MSRPMFSGSKNSIGETVPAVMLTNASIASLVAVHRAEQLLHLRRRRFERRQLRGELVDRQHVVRLACRW